MAFFKEAAFERLREAHRSGRLAHAYLVTGPTGSGKDWLAAQLAALCLDCAPERLPAHPDAHFVQPESKSRRIVTAQIRGLDEAIQHKPLMGANKVVIIHDADRMQPQAANAFLKTLEEPPPGSLILLLSTLPEAILETVLSRCVQTSLLSPRARAVTNEDLAILNALEECLLTPAQPGASDAFRFTRAFQSLLAGAREKAADENEALLKEESSRYKQASDSSSWLQERTEQMKALTESAALRERERIIQILFDLLSQALRAQHGQKASDQVVGRLAEKFSTQNLLARLDALEGLRRRLAMGVQEALSLESGFLEMILVK